MMIEPIDIKILEEDRYAELAFEMITQLGNDNNPIGEMDCDILSRNE